MTKRLLCVSVVLLTVVSARAGLVDQARSSGVKGGLIVHLGCGDAKDTAKLLLDEKYQVHGLASDDAGALELDAPTVGRLDGALAVHGLAERVHDATDERLTDRNVRDAAGALDRVTFADVRRVAEDGDTDAVLLEVQNETVDLAGELDELTRHRTLKAVNARDAVTGGEHGARLGDKCGFVKVLNLLLDDLGDLVGAELHGFYSGRALGSWVARLV